MISYLSLIQLFEISSTCFSEISQSHMYDCKNFFFFSYSKYSKSHNKLKKLWHMEWKTYIALVSIFFIVLKLFFCMFWTPWTKKLQWKNVMSSCLMLSKFFTSLVVRVLVLFVWNLVYYCIYVVPRDSREGFLKFWFFRFSLGFLYFWDFWKFLRWNLDCFQIDFLWFLWAK